jgi:hypothetical protein
MTTTILAADLGKFNSVLCWFEPHTRDAEVGDSRSSFAWRPADPAELFGTASA